MARIVIMYKTPKDADAFDKRCFEANVPLAKKIPGLIKYEVSRGPIATHGSQLAVRRATGVRSINLLCCPAYHAYS
jgi:uncharacterized protein (TIGR02118 family)